MGKDVTKKEAILKKYSFEELKKICANKKIGEPFVYSATPAGAKYKINLKKPHYIKHISEKLTLQEIEKLN
jgi:hypothetical protein